MPKYTENPTPNTLYYRAYRATHPEKKSNKVVELTDEEYNWIMALCFLKG
jgi:hypothetical protein